MRWARKGGGAEGDRTRRHQFTLHEANGARPHQSINLQRPCPAGVMACAVDQALDIEALAKHRSHIGH